MLNLRDLSCRNIFYYPHQFGIVCQIVEIIIIHDYNILLWLVYTEIVELIIIHDYNISPI